MPIAGALVAAGFFLWGILAINHKHKPPKIVSPVGVEQRTKGPEACPLGQLRYETFDGKESSCR